MIGALLYRVKRVVHAADQIKVKGGQRERWRESLDWVSDGDRIEGKEDPDVDEQGKIDTGLEKNKNKKRDLRNILHSTPKLVLQTPELGRPSKTGRHLYSALSIVYSNFSELPSSSFKVSFFQ